MDKKEIFEKAFDRTDLKYIEEPLDRLEEAERRSDRSQASGFSRGWIFAAAALLLIVTAAGSILIGTGVFKKNHKPDNEKRWTIQEAVEHFADESSMYESILNGEEDPLVETAGGKAFGILYTDYLDQRVIEDTSDPTKKVFFENYGGSFLDEKGDLTVYYKKEGENTALKVQAYLEEKAGCSVTFTPVSYSYQELLDYQEKLCKAIQTGELSLEGENAEDLLKAINGVGIDQGNNCLYINLEKVSGEELEQLKELFQEYPCRFDMQDR